MADLVKAVKDHAQEHYEDGGWDVIVEAWSDEDVAGTIRDFEAKTPQQAIQAVGRIVDVYADRQADARIEGADPRDPEEREA